MQTLDRHGASNFLLLLAHTKLLTFKGLYACDASQDTVAEKILGLGPTRLDISMVRILCSDESLLPHGMKAPSKDPSRII